MKIYGPELKLPLHLQKVQQRTEKMEGTKRRRMERDLSGLWSRYGVRKSCTLCHNCVRDILFCGRDLKKGVIANQSESCGMKALCFCSYLVWQLHDILHRSIRCLCRWSAIIITGIWCYLHRLYFVIVPILFNCEIEHEKKSRIADLYDAGTSEQFLVENLWIIYMKHSSGVIWLCCAIDNV